MKNKGKKYKQAATMALLAIGLTQENAVQASLFDRGNGLIYNNVTNTT
jgi:hypothetical protein